MLLVVDLVFAGLLLRGVACRCGLCDVGWRLCADVAASCCSMYD